MHVPRPAVSRFIGGPFPAFAVLFACLYGAYGTESPFFPSFLAARGLTPSTIGIVLAGGTCVRLTTGPLIGLVADRIGARRVLAVMLASSGAIILLYLLSFGFWPILATCLLHSVATTSLTALTDALALGAKAANAMSSYGILRGIGSAGFVAGALASGVLVQHFGLDAMMVAAAVLFVVAALPLPRLPALATGGTTVVRRGAMTLLASPAFRRVLLVAALVIGSHAMIDAFAVIHWRAAGISATTVGLLWSEAVASEIVVFVSAGPALLARLGPARCAAIAATAGVLRWRALALTTDVAALAATQVLHGLTFSLLHLACMRVLTATTPRASLATAQTIYGTFCLGVASAVLTLVSGALYGSVGAAAFWPMAALCVVALPFALKLPGRDLASDPPAIGADARDLGAELSGGRS